MSFQLPRRCLFISSKLTWFLLLPAPAAAPAPARQSSPEVTTARHNLSFPLCSPSPLCSSFPPLFLFLPPLFLFFPPVPLFSPLFLFFPLYAPLFSNLDPYRLNQQCPTDLAAACKLAASYQQATSKPTSYQSAKACCSHCWMECRFVNQSLLCSAMLLFSAFSSSRSSKQSLTVLLQGRLVQQQQEQQEGSDAITSWQKRKPTETWPVTRLENLSAQEHSDVNSCHLPIKTSTWV